MPAENCTGLVVGVLECVITNNNNNNNRPINDS